MRAIGANSFTCRAGRGRGCLPNDLCLGCGCFQAFITSIRCDFQDFAFTALQIAACHDFLREAALLTQNFSREADRFVSTGHFLRITHQRRRPIVFCIAKEVAEDL